MQPKRYLYFYSFFFFFFLGWDRLFRGRHTVTFKCFSLFHFCFSRSDEAVACAAQEEEEEKKKCFERGWGRNENLFISKQQFDNSSIVDDE